MRRVAALLGVVLAGACSQGSADVRTRELNVFAASSLSEAFGVLGEEFERANTGVDVNFAFGGSTALARQISDGADADVFAAADELAMAAASDEVGEPVVFARNRSTIVVEPGNPKRIRELRDLAGDVVVVLCAPEVPCGRYAQQALDEAGVSVQAASLEENVKAVVARVALGEADAGVVYKSDALASRGEVDEVEIQTGGSAEAVYPMAVVDRAPNADFAREWVRFVTSPAGARILRDHGFLAP